MPWLGAGVAEGSGEGEGLDAGVSVGAALGSTEGATEGSTEGATEGSGDGVTEGSTEGSGETSGEGAGEIRFFDVEQQPPIRGLPREELLTLEQFVSEVRAQFENRNNPPFQFGEPTLTEDEGVPIAEADIVPPDEEPC